jgi:hypothetical protein
MALGISALGKKRHRVEIARRLVVGSLVAAHENQKDIYYQADDTQGHALFRVLDTSLPWWTEKTSWGRWKKVSPAEDSKGDSLAPAALRLGKDSFGVHLASSEGRVNYSIDESPSLLSQVIPDFAGNSSKQSPQSQIRMVAM